MLHQRYRLAAALCAGASLSLLSSGAAAEHRWGKGPPSWGPGELVLTGAGCPIETSDARSLMVATGRTGGLGGLDIWAIDRAAVGEPWSAPKPLPAPVNSPQADFCPSPFERSLFFVSARPAEACPGDQGGDIYLTRQSPAGDWSEPIHLPCAPHGPNTAGVERSPSLVETWYGTFLFFSTNQGVAGAGEDIYVSFMGDEGNFTRGYLVNALSTTNFQDQMPTVRELDGGFAVTFNSDRPDALAQGGQDVYYASASFLPFWWSKPRNVGPNVNTAANETRASLSWDGQRLYAGRGDVYVSERQ